MQLKLALATLVLTSFATTTFGGDEQVKIAYAKPVVPVVNRSGAVELRYLKACGEELRGVLVRESRESVVVGVVVERTDKLCSALPVEQSFVSPLRWSISDSRKITSVANSESSRVILTEVQDVTLSQSGSSIVWQDSCRAHVGLVISPNKAKGVHAVSLNMASSAQAATNGVACARDLITSKFSTVRLTADQVHLLRKPGKMADLYVTKLASPTKIMTNASQQLTVQWMGSCKERAMGVLFGGASGNELAVVVAYAPNASCEQQAKKVQEIKINELMVTANQRLVGMGRDKIEQFKAQSQFRYEMIPLAKISLQRSGQGQWLMAGIKQSCARQYGLVVGNDSVGNVAMAALSDSDHRICHVSEVASAQTMTAPLVGPAVGPMPKIFGLKMFGTLID